MSAAAAALPVDPRVAAGLQAALDAGEVGVQVAAYVGEELVVDATAGATAPGGPPAGPQTVFPILSAVKAATAVAVHLQAERGRLDYADPVARYWPAFGAAGKDAITIAEVLSHRAGVPQLPAGTTVARMGDWRWMVDAIGAIAPAYPPGTANAYHALSWGWILGELVRRTDRRRRPFGTFVAEELCAPLGIEGLWIGIPEAVAPRVATVVAARYPGPSGDVAPLRAAAVPAAIGPPQAFQNDPAFQRACVPAGNGIADARSLARLYAMLAGGGAPLLSEATLARCARPRPGFADRDLVTGTVTPFGQGGLQLGDPPAPAVADPVVAGGPNSLWHPGGGGTYAWSDPHRHLAVAICHNRLVPTGDPRPPAFLPLADAIRAVAAEHTAQ